MQTKKLLFMAALALTFAACSEDIEQVQQPARTGGIPFSATISIEKSTTNRALTEDAVNNKIEASWAENDEVALIHNDVVDKVTVASVTGGVATITGSITGSPSDGDAVTVVYPYSAVDATTKDVKADVLAAQDGTLTGTGGTSIAENYDVRKGTGTLKVDDTATLDGNVSLTNQFAIFKFTTQNASSTAISVNSLTVTIGTQHYVVTPASATNVLYVALPAVSSQTVIFSAVGSDSKNYFLAKDNRTFAAGKYYQSPLSMTQGVHLAALTANYTAQDGDVLTGTLDGETQPYKISIAAPVAPATTTSITLDNAVINGWSDGASLATGSAVNWAGLTPLGNATIILKDGTTNSVRGFFEDNPGILAAVGSTLVIKGETAGTGTLTASSNGKGAGIGGGSQISCGNIEIQGGIINATGGGGAAGIGGGSSSTCGSITISGGTINATGGSNAAGIGSGLSGECGDITIANTVTSVTATKGDSAPNSIGAGDGGTCGTVTIGGTVTGNITASPYIYPIPGLLSGKFSVSATQKVQFSQGNLQATYNSSAWSWAFAANQWDYIGDATTTPSGNGNIVINGNGTVSENNVTVDLFGWSTAATFLGINNSNSSIYTGDFADWGSNATVQAGIGTGWRTLTSAEWLYLFGMEANNTDKSGHARYRKYFRATVNSIPGIVVLPDDISGISNIPEESSRGTASSFDGKTYDTSAWATLEAAGCVFLPAAGYRNSTSVSYAGSTGVYWSSTLYDDSERAYILYFRSSNVNPAYYNLRFYGYSVRLVQDVAVP